MYRYREGELCLSMDPVPDLALCGQQGGLPTSNGNIGPCSAADHGAQESAGESGRRHSESGGRTGGETPLGRASRAGSLQDSEEARSDADLEASVLDTLTDSVLTGDVLLIFIEMQVASSSTPWCLHASSTAPERVQLSTR